jgi:hypothetical protein
MLLHGSVNAIILAHTLLILILLLKLEVSSTYSHNWLFAIDNNAFDLFSSGSSDTSSSSTVPTSDKNDTGMGKEELESPTASTNESQKSSNLFPVLGHISVNFRDIESGRVILMCGSSEFLILNLHWILASLSRSSRKKLANWLNQKTLQSGFPLGGFDNNPSSAKSTETESAKTSAKAVSTGVSLEKSNSSSTSHANLAIKVCRCLGLDLSSMSNSIADSLRQMLKAGDIRISAKNSLINPDSGNPNSFSGIEFRDLMAIAKKNLQTRRSGKKNSGKSNKSK